MLHCRPEISSLDRPQNIPGRHGGHSFRIKIGIDDETSVSHVLLEHSAERTILYRPDPFLRRKRNDLFVECRYIHHKAAVLEPFGKHRREISIADGPEPFLGENRCDAPGINDSLHRKGIPKGGEHWCIDGNVGNGRKTVKNGGNRVEPHRKIEEMNGGPDGSEGFSFERDFVPEIRDDFHDVIDVVANGAIGCQGTADAFFLDVQYIVQKALGFLETAAVGIGTGLGAAHQEDSVLFVSVHPNGSGIQSRRCGCRRSNRLRCLFGGKGGNCHKKARADDYTLKI
mmetsp:Transcript_79/g.204  ORF Transcript_79/g.204 Transcript_79/m.204 type:complete len:285 (-) Transcript_79:206-1060(-)